MKRIALVLLAVFLLAGATFADIPVGTIEDGYSYAGSGYWKNASGDYFRRREVQYTGYKWSYGYRYPQVFYYWEYVSASKPAASLTPASPDADWIDFLKSREKVQGKIALDEQQNKSFLAKLAAVGVSPAYPSLPAYSGLSGRYAVASGSTLYGYGANAYSYSQTADIYGPFDPSILQQGAVAFTKAALQAATDANAQLNQINSASVAAAERLQAQKIQGELALKTLEMTRPPSKVTTTVTGMGTQPIPAPVPIDDLAKLRTDTLKTKCLSCHAGPDAKGKFDMTGQVSDAQRIKMLQRITLPIDDQKHMPPTQDGKIQSLSFREIQSIAH